MASEIMDRQLLYEEPVDDQQLDFNSNILDYQSSLTPVRDVTYDYLHDAESFCWVHLWILLSRIPHSPSQALANSIFQNVGTTSAIRRKLFLGGIRKPEIDSVHHTIRELAQLWNFPRKALLKAFRSTPPDERTDNTYTTVYKSLCVFCDLGLKIVDAPTLSPVRRLGYSTALPSRQQSRPRGTADDEDYVPPKDDSESRDQGAENAQPGKRSRQEDEASTFYVLVPTAPMKKKRGDFSQSRPIVETVPRGGLSWH